MGQKEGMDDILNRVKHLGVDIRNRIFKWVMLFREADARKYWSCLPWRQIRTTTLVRRRVFERQVRAQLKTIFEMYSYEVAINSKHSTSFVAYIKHKNTDNDMTIAKVLQSIVQ